MKWETKIESATSLRLDGTTVEGYRFSWRQPGERRWKHAFVVREGLDDFNAALTQVVEALSGAAHSRRSGDA